MNKLSPSQWMNDERNGGDCAERKSGQRRLLIRHELVLLLQLSHEQLQILINTRQITALRIAGEERFDSRELDQLIDSYKATAARRPQ